MLQHEVRAIDTVGSQEKLVHGTEKGWGERLGAPSIITFDHTKI